MRKKYRDAAADQVVDVIPGRGRMMTRLRWTIAGSLLGVGGAAWIGSGHGRQGDGGTLSGTVQTLVSGFQDASETIQDKYHSARTSARNLGLEQQIESRLRQDKTLDAARIELHVEDEGTAVLKGLVIDEDSKEKAVQLVRDTKGVVKVIDHLAVPPAPRVIVSPTSADKDDTAAVATRPRSVR
jgi:hypothetical protein